MGVVLLAAGEDALAVSAVPLVIFGRLSSPCYHSHVVIFGQNPPISLVSLVSLSITLAWSVKSLSELD